MTEAPENQTALNHPSLYVNREISLLEFQRRLLEEAKDERLARLNEKAWKHAAERCEARLGKVEEVLVDGPADKTPDAYYGKSRQNRTVVFHPAHSEVYQTGDVVSVRVDRHKIANLYGKAIATEPKKAV